jgi:hypothetical protein
MRTYSLFVGVAPGTGNYGTAERCLFDGEASFADICKLAGEMARTHSTPVRIFSGKNIGRWIYTMYPESILVRTCDSCRSGHFRSFDPTTAQIEASE